jgi:hypothetical protein
MWGSFQVKYRRSGEEKPDRNRCSAGMLAVQKEKQNNKVPYREKKVEKWKKG